MDAFKVIKWIFYIILIWMIAIGIQQRLFPIKEELCIYNVIPEKQTIVLQNRFERDIDISGFYIVVTNTQQRFTFPEGKFIFRKRGYDDFNCEIVVGKEYRMKTLKFSHDETLKDNREIMKGKQKWGRIWVWEYSGDRLFYELGDRFVQLYDNGGHLIDSYKY